MTANFLRKFCSTLILLVVTLGLTACGGFLPKTSDNRHNQPLSSTTVAALKAMGSSPGEAMMIRIFKQEQVLEVWKRTHTGEYRKFKDYQICTYSGDIGPKFKEGDRQSPEGIYTITPGLMHPKSNFYLAFNTGFPNKFDRSWGRTGSDLMVHGDCSSSGCYAMTDGGIAEIYALARESFKGGNPSFQLQAFPFKMTPENLAKHASSQHLDFWKNIKQGYDLFELNKTPPAWDVCERRYVFNASGGGMLNALGPCPPITLQASLVNKQKADDAAFNKLLTAEERKAVETAAIKARGEALGGAVNSMFTSVGNLFGGGTPAPARAADGAAPSPMPTIAR